MNIYWRIAVCTVLTVLSACDGSSQRVKEFPLAPKTLETEVIVGLLKASSSVITPLDSDDSKLEPFVHDNASLESWRVLMLLNTEYGAQLVATQRFDRFALDKKNQVSVGSAWHYERMLQLNHQQAVFGDTNNDLVGSSASQIARESLALSGASSEKNTVWLGPYRLIKALKPAARVQNMQANCTTAFSVMSPQLDLSLNDLTCNDSQAVGRVFYKNSYASNVEGKHKSTATHLSGVAWVQQLWGADLWQQTGAIHIDNAWLLLDEKFSLQIVRSRRKSGKGPVLSTASLAANAIDGSHSFSVNFASSTGGKNESGGIDYKGWSINSEHPRIALNATRVQQLSHNAFLERTLYAVQFTGTHQGVGIVELATPPGVLQASQE